jgi:formate-dependent nitrite reductase membrane component NrfD
MLAVDLFCSGLGAGAFIVAAVLALTTGERFKKTVCFGAWAGAIAIAVGVVMLLLDVGQPFRAVVLFQSFTHLHSSWMARGAWLLFGGIVLNGLFALLWTDRVLKWLESRVKFVVEKRAVWRTILAVLGILVNAGIAVYTGVLLGVLPFRPLWNTWWLPAVFSASALLTGGALMFAFVSLREEGAKRLQVVLGIWVLLLIAAEGVLLWQYLNVVKGGTADAARSVETLLGGGLGTAFWAVVVGLGLAVPLLWVLFRLTGVRKLQAAVVPLVGVVSCLIGAWTLRFVVLAAGLPQSLTSPAFSQALDGVRFFVSK